MTSEQFELICTALADKVQALLKEKEAMKTDIYLKDYEISELKRKLAEAEGMETKSEVTV